MLRETLMNSTGPFAERLRGCLRDGATSSRSQIDGKGGWMRFCPKYTPSKRALRPLCKGWPRPKGPKLL